MVDDDGIRAMLNQRMVAIPSRSLIEMQPALLVAIRGRVSIVEAHEGFFPSYCLLADNSLISANAATRSRLTDRRAGVKSME